MLIKDFNLSGLNSELVNNLDGNTDIEIPIQLTKRRLKNFNNRKVTPNNINKMIEICDYFMIDNTESFMINNSIPTDQKYMLDDVHKNKIILPDFMKGKIINNEIITLCAEHYHDYWRNRKMWWPTDEAGKPDWSTIYYYIVDHYYGYCLALSDL